MKTYLLTVYIEVKAQVLNRTFTYLYTGEETINKGTRVIVNFHNREVVAYVTNVSEIEDINEYQKTKPNFVIKHITRLIDTEPILTPELFELANIMSEHYFAPLIDVLQVMLPPSLRPVSGSLSAPKVAYEKFVRAIDNSSNTQLTLKQQTVYDQIKLKKTSPKADYSPSIIKILIDRHLIEEQLVERDRFKISDQTLDIISKENILTKDQLKVLNQFRCGVKDTYLLQGVTGSGKSEVYLTLAQEFLNMGKGVIFIVSEISLTPLMIALCKNRFQDSVAVLHSNLTPAQKYDQYRKIKSGQAKIVVGARSAIFAPIENLGLIIIDEEHTGSYHQDSSPYYQVQDVAQFRQQLNPGLKIILGSATPSLLTKAKAEKGVYGFLELPNRVNQKALPHVKVVNMLDYTNLLNDSPLISKDLYNGINNTLAKNEQAILLLNRRGFAAYLECERCHTIIRCPECDGYLSYHKGENKLKCHRCDLTFDYPTHCQECGYHSFYNVGFGTEALEEELHKLFPNARIKRLDADVKKNEQNSVNILNAFNRNEIDILVGTQMIAKGHDFENVTFSAVLAADIGLKIPNFMASENAFALVYQTIGRAGRGDKEGTALIQTFNPDHYAISLAATQDYNSFFKHEMYIRKISNFPPYYSLVLLHIFMKNSVNQDFLLELRQILEDNMPKDTIITGPYSPYVQKIGPFVKRLVLLRTKDLSQIRKTILTIIEAAKGNKDVKVEVEVNPQNIF